MNIPVKAVFSSMIAVVMLPGIALTQSKPDDAPLKPLSVCDVLANLSDYNGKGVVVVGRLDYDWNPIDGRSFLSEDQCHHPLTTDGYRWPNRIIIWQWEEGLPKPPWNPLKIEHGAEIEKLLFIRTTTALHVDKGPPTAVRTVQNEWGIAYGSIFSAAKLERGCKRQLGCGGFYGAPAMIVVQPNGVRSVKDAELSNQKSGK